MKLLPIVALLFATSSHAAEPCEARIQSAFARVKPRAVAIIPALQASTWYFKWFMSDDFIAQTRPRVLDIEVNKSQMCQRADSEIEAVIAHEFGHLISRTLNNEHMLTKAGQEDYANYYAARLVPDSSEYLSILDNRCIKGNMYFCEAAKAWRMGIVAP